MTGVEYAAYGACAATAALLVYRYDLYDREPWYLVVATAAAGAVVMGLLGGIEDAAVAWLGGAGSSPYLPALVAASCEEAARLLIVVAVAVAVPRFFNDPMDGLVYGSIAGIGMALEESWALAAPSSAGLSLLPADLVRLSGHLVMGGITGFGAGAFKRPAARRLQSGFVLAGCAIGSTLLHFLWDVAALAGVLGGGLARWPAMAASAVMLTGMIAYAALVVIGADWSRQALAPPGRKTLWGWPFSSR